MNKDGGLGRLCSLESEISQFALPWRWPKGSRDPGLGEPSDGGGGFPILRDLWWLRWTDLSVLRCPYLIPTSALLSPWNPHSPD